MRSYFYCIFWISRLSNSYRWPISAITKAPLNLTVTCARNPPVANLKFIEL